jgi:hypothetical protein
LDKLNIAPQHKASIPATICTPIYMTFNAWLLKKEIPDSDHLAVLIQQAGRNGIPENELRSGVELPKKLVDELLAALVDARPNGSMGVAGQMSEE